MLLGFASIWMGLPISCTEIFHDANLFIRPMTEFTDYEYGKKHSCSFQYDYVFFAPLCMQ